MELETLAVIIIVTGVISIMASTLFKDDTEVEDLYQSMKKPCLHDWSARLDNKMTCLSCNKVAGE